MRVKRSYRIYSEDFGRFLSPDPLFEQFDSWAPYHFAFNNPVMYSDPSGLAPKKEKREAKLLDAPGIYSESDLGHFGMLNEMFALQAEESRRNQANLMEGYYKDWEEFDRWQAVTRNKMKGGSGDKYDNSYDLALAAENKKKKEAREKDNKEKGNVEGNEKQDNKEEITDEQISKELKTVQNVLQIPDYIKSAEDLAFQTLGIKNNVLQWSSRSFGLGFIILDLGLEYATTNGNISEQKLIRATATGVLLFTNPYIGVPLMIIINAPSDNMIPGMKFTNPKDNTNVKIYYNRYWRNK